MNDLTVASTNSLQVLSEAEWKEQIQIVQRVMQSVMKNNEHYGIIPGCGKKPTLLKAGAEKLAFVFRLAPEFDGERNPIDLGKGHREYIIKTTLRHITSGAIWGQGLGSCSTMEKKYRYRTGPSENTGALVPKEYWDLRKINPEQAQAVLGGRGFVAKKDGKDWFIFQQGDSIENDCIADQYNTVLKMAKKRSIVDATLTATAASDIFTQDLEEMVEVVDTRATPIQHPEPAEDDGNKPYPEAAIISEEQGTEPFKAPPLPINHVISELQSKRFYAIGKGTGKSDDQLHDLLAKYGIKSSKEIPKNKYDEICAKAGSKAERQPGEE